MNGFNWYSAFSNITTSTIKSAYHLKVTINNLVALEKRLDVLLTEATLNQAFKADILPALAAFEGALKTLPGEIPELVAHWTEKWTLALDRYSKLVLLCVGVVEGDQSAALMQPEKISKPFEAHVIEEEKVNKEGVKKNSSEEENAKDQDFSSSISNSTETPISTPKTVYSYCDQLEDLFCFVPVEVEPSPGPSFNGESITIQETSTENKVVVDKEIDELPVKDVLPPSLSSPPKLSSSSYLDLLDSDFCTHELPAPLLPSPPLELVPPPKLPETSVEELATPEPEKVKNLIFLTPPPSPKVHKEEEEVDDKSETDLVTLLFSQLNLNSPIAAKDKEVFADDEKPKEGFLGL